MSELAKIVRTSSSRSRLFLFMLVLGTETIVRASFAQKHSEWSLSAAPNIPPSEINALYDIYNATNGENWHWSDDTAVDGIPWNFTDTALNNPCVDYWQGINCSFTSPFEYYHVTFVSLPSYGLIGTLPNTLGALSQLQHLDFQDNLLRGSIPNIIGNLVQLQDLLLNTNQFTSTIPDSVGYLYQLEHLSFNANQLSGSIPDALGNLTRLQSLGIQSNMLVGSIPDSLGNLLRLQSLYLAFNQLTARIPQSFGKLVELQFLRLDSNKLSGTIPESLGNLLHLQYLRLDVNRLTGTIPVSLANLADIQFLELNTNQLSGTIPYISSTLLQQIHLYNNRLNGKIPSLGHIASLQALLLHNNYLTGTLEKVFSPSVQLFVKTVVLANNQLSGTIPETIFQLNLQTFVGTSNCFEGPLPISAICNNLKMVSFVIDGMRSAASCRSNLFVGPLSAYSLTHAIGGSIPSCLFQLPNLTTLHLSGNGFTGSIPSSLRPIDALTDLVLSHNELTGSIPSQFQLKGFNNIDLSYNRFSGTLLTSFASNQSVTLDNNRISGNIPDSFHAMTNISILGSNMFSCDYDQSDLPVNDPDRQRYHCGSNSFDALLYVWLGCVVITIIGLYYKWQRLLHIRPDFVLEDTNLYKTQRTIYRITLSCMLYSIVVLLPLYTACSVSFGTQTYAYAYQISAVYMSGVVPFALDWFFWWVFLAGIKVLLIYTPTVSSSNKSATVHIEHSLGQSMAIFVPYLLIDIIVVAGVNATYVYVAVYQSSALLLVVQTLLSIFKVVWGRWALPYILGKLSRSSKHGEVHIFTQIVVNLLNNIVIPCLIVAVVSPNCFYNALVAAPVVTSTVQYTECTFAATGSELCSQFTVFPLSTSFHPPFAYNYQCSASLITYYSPAFVSMCVVSTFASPIVQHLAQWLHGRASLGTFWYKLLDSCLPRIAKPIQGTERDINRGYLNVGGLINLLISTLGLVLTFGIMFPPLSVAFTVSLCATVFFFRRNVSRAIGTAADQNGETFVEIIKTECNSVDAMHILKGSVWLLITVSCWFYTLFLFDTLGDAVGFERAYWVLIVMPLMPLVLFGLYSGVRKYCQSWHEPSLSHEGVLRVGPRVVVVEMQTIHGTPMEVHNILVVETAGIGAVDERTQKNAV